MTIANITLSEKEEVFMRLVLNNENVFDACSKAGIILSSTVLSVIKNTNK
ncbi:MAG: hypothetical protein WBF48_03030 [Halarcobacter sp.]